MRQPSIDEEAARTLSASITATVKSLMIAAGHNITTLSEATGYSRVRISQVLNGHAGKNLWHLSMLCAVARVLRTSVSEIVRLASGEPGISLDTVLERIATEPGSPERLRVLIARALSLYALLYNKPEYEPDKEGDYELKFRCTPREVQFGAPDFWKVFVSNAMNENEIVSVLWGAIERAEKGGGLGYIPFWAALNNA